MNPFAKGEGEHITILDVRPIVDGGRFPIKRIVGDPLRVEATIFRDGHDVIQSVLRWRPHHSKKFQEAPMSRINPGLDLWQGEFILLENTRYFYSIVSWTDRFLTWFYDFEKWVSGGEPDIASELAEGLKLIQSIHRAAKGDDRDLLSNLISKLKEKSLPPQEAVSLLSDETLLNVIARLQKRHDPSVSPEYEVIVDRPHARFGAWYEMFIRSQGKTPDQPATFRDAEERLPDIQKMGFDIIYLAPIHPIGKTNRKGKNNSLLAAPEDPGSPWAIGSKDGGHDAIEPALGTLEDFDHFVESCHKLGMEVALDFALQCSPDHPWVKQHPEWFYQRPDGSIKYAQNPPKKYQDIYPINFDTTHRKALWEEIRRVLLFWIGHGVKIFRVDNPHTKPVRFWLWLIGEIQRKHPEVLFLAEAFTRPAPMKTLAKAGFSQSYTYFTWRHTKAEFQDYLTELAQTEMRHYYRPNFFTNTPDILPKILADGGPAAFKMRLVLAATLSPSFGIYSGYELCENDWIPHHAIPNDIEYADSEKYQIKVRDWNRPGHIKDFISQINAIRRDHRAFHFLDNIRFLPTDNDRILCFLKQTQNPRDTILVAVNLDPRHPHHTTVTIPLEDLGLKSGGRFRVKDLLTDTEYNWSDKDYVRLDPEKQPAHILKVLL